MARLATRAKMTRSTSVVNRRPPTAARSAQTVEVAGSHALMVAHPRPVADLIRTAANQEAS